jgi:hypothetical protein
MADIYNMNGDKLKRKAVTKINVDQNEIHLEIDSSMWCSYEGECFAPLLDNMSQLFVCLFCEHRVDLDIPAIMQEQNPIIENDKESE